MKGKEYASPTLTFVTFTQDVITTSGDGVWDTTTKEWVGGDLEW